MEARNLCHGYNEYQQQSAGKELGILGPRCIGANLGARQRSRVYQNAYSAI